MFQAARLPICALSPFERGICSNLVVSRGKIDGQSNQKREHKLRPKVGGYPNPNDHQRLPGHSGHQRCTGTHFESVGSIIARKEAIDGAQMIGPITPTTTVGKSLGLHNCICDTLYIILFYISRQSRSPKLGVMNTHTKFVQMEAPNEPK